MTPTSENPSHQLAQALAAEIPETRIAQVLSQALAATMTTRAGTVEPDWKTRVQAATLTLAYKVGRPVERQEVVSVNVSADADEDLRSRLARSPALRRSIRSMLEAAEGEVIDA